MLLGEATERDTAGFEAYCEACYFRPGELWREHGAALLEECIEERPGTRPYAWWEFDCPPPPLGTRLKVAGSGVESCALSRHTGIWEYYDCAPEDPPRVESVATFLRRLGLLKRGEEKRVPRAGWRPIRLQVYEVDGERWSRAA